MGAYTTWMNYGCSSGGCERLKASKAMHAYLPNLLETNGIGLWICPGLTPQIKALHYLLLGRCTGHEYMTFSTVNTHSW